MLRLGVSGLVASLFVLALAGWPAAARAQSLFDGLFGVFGGSQPKMSVRRLPPLTPQSNPWSPRHDAPAEDDATSGGSYRTYCVRTCDGYYFPIRSATSPATFRRDAAACEQACGSQARLYYLPKSSDDPAAMMDLSGRTYGELRHAFLYRKRLVDGCACRPMPWSAAERARHLRYAYIEELAALEVRRRQLAETEAAERAKAVAPAADATEISAAHAGGIGPAPADGGVVLASASAAELMPMAAIAAPGPVTAIPAASSRPPARATWRQSGPSSGAVRKKSSASAGAAAFFGNAKQKYRWPGDP
ncbi:MAG: DUF2865 domain-containing protein [Hyphomicrobiaceae bacterium]|nr:DUF2865 domain-containing protein [Hyphomicrobiaceae bacterium]